MKKEKKEKKRKNDNGADLLVDEVENEAVVILQTDLTLGKKKKKLKSKLDNTVL